MKRNEYTRSPLKYLILATFVSFSISSSADFLCRNPALEMTVRTDTLSNIQAFFKNLVGSGPTTFDCDLEWFLQQNRKTQISFLKDIRSVQTEGRQNSVELFSFEVARTLFSQSSDEPVQLMAQLIQKGLPREGINRFLFWLFWAKPEAVQGRLTFPQVIGLHGFWNNFLLASRANIMNDNSRDLTLTKDFDQHPRLRFGPAQANEITAAYLNSLRVNFHAIIQVDQSRFDGSHPSPREPQNSLFFLRYQRALYDAKQPDLSENLVKAFFTNQYDELKNAVLGRIAVLWALGTDEYRASFPLESLIPSVRKLGPSTGYVRTLVVDGQPLYSDESTEIWLKLKPLYGVLNRDELMNIGRDLLANPLQSGPTVCQNVFRLSLLLSNPHLNSLDLEHSNIFKNLGLSGRLSSYVNLKDCHVQYIDVLRRIVDLRKEPLAELNPGLILTMNKLESMSRGQFDKIVGTFLDQVRMPTPVSLVRQVERELSVNKEDEQILSRLTLIGSPEQIRAQIRQHTLLNLNRILDRFSVKEQFEFSLAISFNVRQQIPSVEDRIVSTLRGRVDLIEKFLNDVSAVQNAYARSMVHGILNRLISTLSSEPLPQSLVFKLIQIHPQLRIEHDIEKLFTAYKENLIAAHQLLSFLANRPAAVRRAMHEIVILGHHNRLDQINLRGENLPKFLVAFVPFFDSSNFKDAMRVVAQLYKQAGLSFPAYDIFVDHLVSVMPKQGLKFNHNHIFDRREWRRGRMNADVILRLCQCQASEIFDDLTVSDLELVRNLPAIVHVNYQAVRWTLKTQEMPMALIRRLLPILRQEEHEITSHELLGIILTRYQDEDPHYEDRPQITQQLLTSLTPFAQDLTDLSLTKTAVRDWLLRGLGGIRYNRAYSNVYDLIDSRRLQCDSGTRAYLTFLMHSRVRDLSHVVVLYLPGHVLPGFVGDDGYVRTLETTNTSAYTRPDFPVQFKPRKALLYLMTDDLFASAFSTFLNVHMTQYRDWALARAKQKYRIAFNEYYPNIHYHHESQVPSSDNEARRFAPSSGLGYGNVRVTPGDSEMSGEGSVFDWQSGAAEAKSLFERQNSNHKQEPTKQIENGPGNSPRDSNSVPEKKRFRMREPRNEKLDLPELTEDAEQL